MPNLRRPSGSSGREEDNMPSTSSSAVSSVAEKQSVTPDKCIKPCIITPEQIKPYPKAGARKRTSNQGRKPGRTRILTDTPEKAVVEEAALKKAKTVRMLMPKTVKKRIPPINDSSSDDNESITSGESVLDLSLSDEDVIEVSDFRKEDLKQGNFVLVEFIGGTRQSTRFIYACIVQQPPEEDSSDELSVMALKSIDFTKKVFVANEDDVSFVQVKSVLGILPNPQLVMQGNRCRYVFGKKINVFEK